MSVFLARSFFYEAKAVKSRGTGYCNSMVGQQFMEYIKSLTTLQKPARWRRAGLIEYEACMHVVQEQVRKFLLGARYRRFLQGLLVFAVA